MRRWLAGLSCAVALGGCQPAAVPNDAEAANHAAPPAAPAPIANEAAAPVEPAADASAEAPAEKTVEVPEDAPGLADMSPFRRRAYEAGYRDCSAGRYDPDPWPEAYRIGCGAAQEAR